MGLYLRERGVSPGRVRRRGEDRRRAGSHGATDERRLAQPERRTGRAGAAGVPGRDAGRPASVFCEYISGPSAVYRGILTHIDLTVRTRHQGHFSQIRGAVL